jgi:ABC-type branched-subunit amino acid transport system substrate-binding protein
VRRLAALLVVVVGLAGCGGDDTPSGQKTLVIAVDAPFSRTPHVGETIARGAELAVAQKGRDGGILVGKTLYRLRVKRYDNALSPRRSVENVKRAIRDGAVAIVSDGTGVDASWELARDAGVPVAIVYSGGIGLVDPERRPNVFRIAPTDRGIAFRLAEYLIPKGLKVALLHDDSAYGQEGARALDQSFGENPEAVAANLTLPASALDVSPQVLRARRAGATALLVWARAPAIAKTILAARSAGWDVPIYTPPSGEDPLIRQELADRPEWVDGLTFASGRMTAEVGPAPFLAFSGNYESSFGPDRVGVKTARGQEVIAPPDYAMYSYDFVNVLAAAIAQAGGASDGAKIVDALNEVTIRGANGDERGFNRRNHEGVVDDDVYFAQFHGMTFAPVKDDPLSATLPVIEQRR